MAKCGIIFDLDGTLWDVTDTTTYTANEITKKYGLPVIDADNGLSRAVYIGDTDTDFQSALAAGVEFVYANYGFGEVKDAEYVIGSLKELPKVLPRVFYK